MSDELGQPAATHSVVPAASTARLVFHGTVFRLAGRAVGAVAAVATLRLSTGYLGASGYGAVVTATAFLLLLGVFVDLGLTTIAAREMARQGVSHEALVGLTLALRIGLSLIVFPVALGVGWLLYHDQRAVWTALLILLPMLLLGAVKAAMSALFIARQRNDLDGLVDGVGGLMTLACVSSAVAADLGLRGYLVMLVAAASLTSVLAVFLARRHVALRLIVDRSAWRALLVLALPLGIVQMLNVVYLRIDSIMLSVWRTTEEVGQYGVAYKIIELVMAVPSFFMLALIPSIMAADEARRQRLLQASFDALMTIGAVATVVGVLLAQPIVVLVSSAAFEPAADALVLLLVGAGVSFVTAVYGNALVLADHQRRLVPVTVALVVVNATINVVAIPRYGITGAAASMLVTELVALGYVSRLHQHLSGWRPSYSQVPRVVIAVVAMLLVFVALQGLSLDEGRPLAWLFIAGFSLVGTYGATLAISGGVPRMGAVPWRR